MLRQYIEEQLGIGLVSAPSLQSYKRYASLMPYACDCCRVVLPQAQLLKTAHSDAAVAGFVENVSVP